MKIIYILVNGELKMSPGKVAAQVAHATAMLDKFNSAFIGEYKRAVIVLEAKNEIQMRSLEEYLFNAGLSSYLYIDEGVNEVTPYSLTAMSVQPIDSDDEEKREIFAPFPLYGSNKEVDIEQAKTTIKKYLHSDWHVSNVVKRLNQALEYNGGFRDELHREIRSYSESL